MVRAGRNAYGQLGNNAGTTAEWSPVATVTFGNNLNFTLVSSGFKHSCGIEQTTRAAWCWGYNGYYDLGLGVAYGTHYTPTAVPGGYQFLQLQAGADFTCGVLSNNSAVCWGERWRTGGGFPSSLSGGTRRGGGGPACLPACLPANYPPDCLPDKFPACLPAWIRAGFGTTGCLGNGLTTSQSTPVLVSGSYSFTKVSTSGSADSTAVHACGLLSNQSIVCWGSGSLGQLGNGATSDSTTPVLVSGSSLYIDVSAGNFHTCAVDSTHAARCWGKGSNGILVRTLSFSCLQS